jgi:hypothetical protein
MKLALWFLIFSFFLFLVFLPLQLYINTIPADNIVYPWYVNLCAGAILGFTVIGIGSLADLIVKLIEKIEKKG